MKTEKYGLDHLLSVVHTLRSPGGCDWDRAQNLQTLRSHALDEAAELQDAIDDGCLEGIQEEIGDVLFVTLLLAKVLEQDGHSNIDIISQATAQKLMSRHPHVFDETFSGPLPSWTERKALEKPERESLLDGVARALPPLRRAEQLSMRAARGGFDWDSAEGVLTKLEEELSELREAISRGDKSHTEEELGDVLFTLVNLGRHLNIDPERGLKRTTQKFERRFRGVERELREQHRRVQDVPLDELEIRWQAQKVHDPEH